MSEFIITTINHPFNFCNGYVPKGSISSWLKTVSQLYLKYIPFMALYANSFCSFRGICQNAFKDKFEVPFSYEVSFCFNERSRGALTSRNGY